MPSAATGQSQPMGFARHLQIELASRASVDPGYSLRRFARDLMTDPSYLVRILKGRTRAGGRTIRRLGTLIGLSDPEIEEFVRFRATGRFSAAARRVSDADFKVIDAEVFRIIREWHHFAIMELMMLDSFQPKVSWITRSLGISAAEARSAIARLQQVGLLRIREDGTWEDLSGGFTTSLDKPFYQPAHRELQKELLRKSIQAIDDVPASLRSHTGMTMAIDSSRLTEAKELIRAFRRDLNRFLSPDQGPKDQVYQLCVSLFPMTHPKDKQTHARRDS